MKKILYIGEYYPYFSYKSKLTEFIVNEMKTRGNEVILLSASWCKINEKNFCGSVEKLSDDSVFTRRYFIDPLQFQISGMDILNCYLALGCKVIEKEKIQEVVFADDLKYSLLVELLRKRYTLIYKLFLFDSLIINTLDNYVNSYIRVNLEEYDKIYTYNDEKNFLTNILNVDANKIDVCQPFDIIEEKECKEIKKVFFLSTQVEKKEKIVNLVKEKLRKKDIEIEFLDTEEQRQKFWDVREEGTAVLCKEEIYGRMPLDLSFILTVCKMNRFFLLSPCNFELLKSYKVEYIKVGELFAISKIRFENECVMDVCSKIPN